MSRQTRDIEKRKQLSQIRILFSSGGEGRTSSIFHMLQLMPGTISKYLVFLGNRVKSGEFYSK